MNSLKKLNHSTFKQTMAFYSAQYDTKEVTILFRTEQWQYTSYVWYGQDVCKAVVSSELLFTTNKATWCHY